jgi:hypothetical protein
MAAVPAAVATPRPICLLSSARTSGIVGRTSGPTLQVGHAFVRICLVTLDVGGRDLPGSWVPNGQGLRTPVSEPPTEKTGGVRTEARKREAKLC